MFKKIAFWFLSSILSFGIVFLVQFVFRLIRISGYTKYMGILEFVYAVFILPVVLIMLYYFLKTWFQYAAQQEIFAVILFFSILVSSLIEAHNNRSIPGMNVDAETRDVVETGIFIQFILGLSIAIFWVLAEITQRRRDNAKSQG